MCCTYVIRIISSPSTKVSNAFSYFFRNYLIFLRLLFRVKWLITLCQWFLTHNAAFRNETLDRLWRFIWEDMNYCRRFSKLNLKLLEKSPAMKTIPSWIIRFNFPFRYLNPERLKIVSTLNCFSQKRRNKRPSIIRIWQELKKHNRNNFQQMCRVLETLKIITIMNLLKFLDLVVSNSNAKSKTKEHK